ncbi:MAG: hypothetical protein K0Q71_5836, partial [Thermomicrobiales bacterium]|nr:hypothetical protein [Thermomicrobiales bacterium]
TPTNETNGLANELSTQLGMQRERGNAGGNTRG